MKYALWLVLTALPIVTFAADEPADKWEKTIAAFEAQDKESPPAEGGVVFVGSSSIRLWDLKKSFPELAAVNRGFGGSQIPDAVRYFDRIVQPYKPRVIVFYSGDNDLASGRKPEQLEADFAAFIKLVRSKLPEARLIFIAVKPSPSRWKLIEAQRESNRRIKALLAADTKGTFVDVEKPMLGEDGQPRDELFVQDKLHMSPKGYEIWAAMIKPLLEK